MKRLLSLLLCLALALSLAACGGSDAPTEPPALTVTNAAGETITAERYGYDWDYRDHRFATGMTSVIADSAHPLDEVMRDAQPVLAMPVAISLSEAYAVTLDFGALSPQSVSLRHWGEECWGDYDAASTLITAERQDDGTYTATLIPALGVFAVDAAWDAEDYRGRATYCFRTAAGDAAALQIAAECRFGAADVKKLDLSWLNGSVIVQTGAQTDEILVTERADRALADGERMTCTLEGDTLRVRFLPSGFTGSFDTEKYLTIYVPERFADALSALEIETTSAHVSVDGLTAREVEISTVSGGVGLFGSYEDAEIETTSGGAVLEGAFGTVDFESVSGALEITANAALALEAETTSGTVAVALPEGCGVTLRFATTSGALDTLLTQRDGTMVACGDRFEEYIIPGEPGAPSCSVVVSTVSGDLSVGDQPIG